MLAIGLVGALIVLGFVVRSLNNTQDELVQTQADLVRVEEGAAGSAIVSAQVLEISRQIAELEPEISAGLNQAITELENFSNSSLEFNVAVDETVVIDTEITIDRDFSFPVDETLQKVDVPVKVDVPIDLDIDVPINETVPVRAEVPVKLDIPISVDIAETDLKLLADQLAVGLRNVQTVVGDLTG